MATSSTSFCKIKRSSDSNADSSKLSRRAATTNNSTCCFLAETSTTSSQVLFNILVKNRESSITNRYNITASFPSSYQIPAQPFRAPFGTVSCGSVLSNSQNTTKSFNCVSSGNNLFYAVFAMVTSSAPSNLTDPKVASSISLNPGTGGPDISCRLSANSTDCPDVGFLITTTTGSTTTTTTIGSGSTTPTPTPPPDGYVFLPGFGWQPPWAITIIVAVVGLVLGILIYAIMRLRSRNRRRAAVGDEENNNHGSPRYKDGKPVEGVNFDGTLMGKMAKERQDRYEDDGTGALQKKIEHARRKDEEKKANSPLSNNYKGEGTLMERLELSKKNPASSPAKQEVMEDPQRVSGKSNKGKKSKMKVDTNFNNQETDSGGTAPASKTTSPRKKTRAASATREATEDEPISKSAKKKAKRKSKSVDNQYSFEPQVSPYRAKPIEKVHEDTENESHHRERGRRRESNVEASDRLDRYQERSKSRQVRRMERSGSLHSFDHEYPRAVSVTRRRQLERSHSNNLTPMQSETDVHHYRRREESTENYRGSRQQEEFEEREFKPRKAYQEPYHGPREVVVSKETLYDDEEEGDRGRARQKYTNRSQHKRYDFDRVDEYHEESGVNYRERSRTREYEYE
ncbi:hypothetical protein HDV05_001174 [Chytridiales sp. JEL 0842]|nr:hypothetical protein HDV05_001174 [Chytridiales sp. JEL 0842]